MKVAFPTFGINGNLVFGMDGVGILAQSPPRHRHDNCRRRRHYH